MTGVLAWHLGELHAYERVLTLVLAFGPFLLLAAVIWVRRQQDGRDEPVEEAQRDR